MSCSKGKPRVERTFEAWINYSTPPQYSWAHDERHPYIVALQLGSHALTPIVNRQTLLLLSTCFSPPLISPGNVAWMHVLAARHLQLKPDILAGQVYYSYDDTPTTKAFLIRYQLLSCMDPSIRLGSHIPYWKMWLLIHLHRIIEVILSPFWKPQPFLNLPLLHTIVTTFSYETDKASRHFGYKPLYSWQESKVRTARWLEVAMGNLSSQWWKEPFLKILLPFIRGLLHLFWNIILKK